VIIDSATDEIHTQSSNHAVFKKQGSLKFSANINSVVTARVLPYAGGVCWLKEESVRHPTEIAV
jgi:hypothetical protein